MKKIVYIIAITILSFSIISCGQKTVNNAEDHEHEEHNDERIVYLNKQQQAALHLKLGTFEMRNLTTVIKTNGQLEVPPENTADITAILGGNVKFIRVFIGDFVKKGQTLAILEHPNYISLQENFAVIASKLEFLEQEYFRQKELYENEVGSGKDFQKAKAEYHTAQAKYEGLKSRLLLLNISPNKVMNGNISSTIHILSPISGYVNEVNIKLGTYVDAKDKLFQVTDNSAIHADFVVYEKDVHLLQQDQKIHFTVSNRPGKEYTANIFAIGKQFDSKTRAIHIHAVIKEPSDELIPGMYITGHLHTDENYVSTLPNDAIVRDGTKSFIFVVVQHDEKNHEGIEQDENNETLAFKMQEVITGQQDDGYTEVHLIQDITKSTKIVMNAAYYLLADMDKEETEHDH